MRWPPLVPEADHATEPQANLDPTPTPPISLGGVVAEKYRVDRVIGFGGMGIVCAATHLELGTPIAIKFVRPEKGSDERAVARFLTEARAAAKLQSQFACRVMDCASLPDGSPYIVMEYLVGEDLRSRVATRGPLSVEEAVALALQACEALAEAHSKHIVHRDVKPENLFLAEGPGGAQLLKVLDFGISKQLSPLGQQRSLTDSSESIGSPAHMSPEQMIDPGGVDFRTDIWSLGVVLYEILTGQLPFAGEFGPQLCANVMTTDPIPPQAHRADIPEGLARVILRCLEKNRERRFADIGELSVALKPFGGAGAALAAARVEQIFGRVEPAESSIAPSIDAGNESTASRHAVGAIPGVPRRGLGRRVGVGLVLFVATGLAAYAVRRTVLPVRLEATTTTAPAPSVSAQPSALESPPAPSVASNHVKPKPVLRPMTAPARRPADTSYTPSRPMDSPSPSVDAAPSPSVDAAPSPSVDTAPSPSVDAEPSPASTAPDTVEYPVPKPPELPPPSESPPAE